MEAPQVSIAAFHTSCATVIERGILLKQRQTVPLYGISLETSG